MASSEALLHPLKRRDLCALAQLPSVPPVHLDLPRTATKYHLRAALRHAFSYLELVNRLQTWRELETLAETLSTQLRERDKAYLVPGATFTTFSGPVRRATVQRWLTEDSFEAQVPSLWGEPPVLTTLTWRRDAWHCRYRGCHEADFEYHSCHFNWLRQFDPILAYGDEDLTRWLRTQPSSRQRLATLLADVRQQVSKLETL